MLERLGSTSGLARGSRRGRGAALPCALRILVADPDAAARRELARILGERYAPAALCEVDDAAAAIDAIDLWHPDLCVVDLGAPGHPQRGFRVLLDAASIGVAVVLRSGPIDELIRRRLDDLGAGWIPRDAAPGAVLAATDRALGTRSAHAGALLPGLPSGPGPS